MRPMARCNLKFILGGAAGLWFASALMASPAASASKDLLKFTAEETWLVQTGSKMEFPDPRTGKKSAKETQAMAIQKVLKVFPGGVALIEMTSENPSGGTSQSYSLITPDGLIYNVQGPTKFASLEEKAMAEQMGVRNDVEILKKTSSPEEWLKGETPLHWLKVPHQELKPGQISPLQRQNENWTLARLPDEKVEGVSCEVYLAKTTRGSVPVHEKTWFDRKGGAVLKRVIGQGGENFFESTESRKMASGKEYAPTENPAGNGASVKSVLEVSQLAVDAIEAMIRETSMKSMLEVYEVKKLNAKDDQEYIGSGPYTSKVEAVLGVHRKPRDTHAIKILARVNPRYEPRSIVGKSHSAGGPSVLIVEGEADKTYHLYYAEWASDLLERREKKVQGENDKFFFKEFVNSHDPQIKTAAVILKMEYTPEMKLRAKTLAESMDPAKLVELMRTGR